MHVRHLAQELTNHRGCNYFYSVISKDSSLCRRGVGDSCWGNISFHAPPISLSSWSPLTPVFLCFFSPTLFPSLLPGTGACQQHPVVSFGSVSQNWKVNSCGLGMDGLTLPQQSDSSEHSREPLPGPGDFPSSSWCDKDWGGRSCSHKRYTWYPWDS